MTLRLPISLTTAEERKAYRAKRSARPDEMSKEDRARIEEIYDAYWEDAFACIESLLETNEKAVDAIGRKTGEVAFANRIVAYTQGRSVGVVAVLARLWADSRTVTKFNREQRAVLEKRIAALEARPVFEDAGVWVADKGYRNGHGVTHDGSYWIARRETHPGERPGASDAFRLAVKRGRDGRSAA
jgi:hypothetical protein